MLTFLKRETSVIVNFMLINKQNPSQETDVSPCTRSKSKLMSFVNAKDVRLRRNNFVLRTTRNSSAGMFLTHIKRYGGQHLFRPVSRV